MKGSKYSILLKLTSLRINNDAITNIGRILMGVFLIYVAFITALGSGHTIGILRVIPPVIRYIVSAIWFCAGSCFLFKKYVSYVGIFISAFLMICVVAEILFDETVAKDNILLPIVSIAVAGGSLIIVSDYQDVFDTGLYRWGVSLVGIVYLLSGLAYLEIFDDWSLSNLVIMVPPQYVKILAVCWCATALSFIFDVISRLFALISTVCIIVIMMFCIIFPSEINGSALNVFMICCGALASTLLVIPRGSI